MNIQISNYARLWLNLLVVSLALATPRPSNAQEHPANPDKLPEMQITNEGFLAINTPKGWFRTDGPGLVFFLRKGDKKQTANVWIYINSEPIGPSEEAKTFEAYIESDVAGFKDRFKEGSVQKEEPLDLPYAETNVPVITFQSGEEHNSFEEVVYIPERGRVLLLVLSARKKEAFAQARPVFQEFAKSYRGSISPGQSPKKP